MWCRKARPSTRRRISGPRFRQLHLAVGVSDAQKPVVQVIGQSESDLIPKWGSSLLAVRFTDNEGGDADEIEFDFSVTLPLQAPPAEGTRYRLLYGWEAGALRDAGSFTYQNSRISFSADHGWVLTITARSADFVDADKAEETEHFEEMTAGEIFSRLAQVRARAPRFIRRSPIS